LSYLFIYKDTFTLYQKNLKANTKLLDQIQVLHKKLNAHVITISNLMVLCLVATTPSVLHQVDGRKKSPPSYVTPSTFDGWVEIPTLEDNSATELGSTGTQLRESPRKKARASPPAATTAANQKAAALPRTIYASKPRRASLKSDDSGDEMD
jgi:hypothetical protein